LEKFGLHTPYTTGFTPLTPRASYFCFASFNMVSTMDSNRSIGNIISGFELPDMILVLYYWLISGQYCWFDQYGQYWWPKLAILILKTIGWYWYRFRDFKLWYQPNI